jgi:hypothetical protein
MPTYADVCRRMPTYAEDKLGYDKFDKQACLYEGSMEP